MMNRISVLPVETRSPLSREEACWTAFLDVAGVPYQHKPLIFTEPDTGASFNQHTPSFLLQYSRALWLEVLPALNAAVLPQYDQVLHFARTILMVDQDERSGYWPVSLDCIFVAFGARLTTGPLLRHIPGFRYGFKGKSDADFGKSRLRLGRVRFLSPRYLMCGFR